MNPRKLARIVVLLAILVSIGSFVSTSAEEAPILTEAEIRQELVLTALGQVDADLVIVGTTVLDVHTGTWMHNTDIAVKGQRIAWVGPSGSWPGSAAATTSGYGYYAVPGFIESHKHIESSHLTPEQEARLVLPMGNTSTMEASHEFGNVTSEHNAEFWLTAQKANLPLKVFAQLGSAIPPTPFEFTGGYYGYEEISAEMARDPMVVGLGEVMDWPSVWNPEMPGYDRMWDVMQATWDSRGVVEGHGSRMYAVNDINAFAAAGLSSDHSLREGAEALDKLRRGVALQLKPGAIEKVVPYLQSIGVTDWSMISVTTDDRDVADTLALGGMNYNIRVAIEAGAPIEVAYAMGSINPARHWHVEHLIGSIAPGRYADVVLLRDPKTVDIYQVYASGQLVAQDGELLIEIAPIQWPSWATDTMNIGRELSGADFAIKAPEGKAEVTAAILSPFWFAPDFKTATLPVSDGTVAATDGYVKFSIIDRYNGNGAVASMYWEAVGPITPDTAVGSSVAHDHHNLWILGSSDEAMALAANRLAAIGGGWVVVSKGEVLDEVPYEVGGLMSARPAEVVATDLEDFWASLETLKWLGGGVSDVKRQIFATLTCQPWKWVLVAPFETCESGLVNVTTGECSPVVW